MSMSTVRVMSVAADDEKAQMTAATAKSKNFLIIKLIDGRPVCVILSTRKTDEPL